MEEKHQFKKFSLSFSLVVSLGLVSFASCIIAEVKKTKKDDLKLNGRLCYLPESEAFGCGIVALVCLFIAQVIGNSMVICKAKKHTLDSTFLLIAWISFGIAITLLSGATSMSRRQPYGKGWLDGECYLVKSGVYVASAVLVLVTTSFILCSAVLRLRKNC